MQFSKYCLHVKLQGWMEKGDVIGNIGQRKNGWRRAKRALCGAKVRYPVCIAFHILLLFHMQRLTEAVGLSDKLKNVL